VVLVVVLVISALAAAGWAICFHRTAYGAVHRPASSDHVATTTAPPVRRPSTATAGVGRETGPARGAVGQLEAIRAPMPAEPVSVLGWDSFTVTSVLFFDGTVMLACRRLDTPGGPRPLGFEESDQTMVLRLGEDDRADAALAVFEDWSRRRSPLRLRPIEVAGAIEVLDDAGRTRIRAPLIAA
jgi:hypothetical protein